MHTQRMPHIYIYIYCSVKLVYQQHLFLVYAILFILFSIYVQLFLFSHYTVLFTISLRTSVMFLLL